MRECRRCGVLHPGQTRGYCSICRKEMRAERLTNPNRRRGPRQRNSNLDVSKAPLPPPGAPASDRVTCRPYGSAFGHDADWQDGTRPEAFEIRCHSW
jgi:hypothetical protein